jgi:heme/copper-type cytochrome/quinol oxidase subunit 3
MWFFIASEVMFFGGLIAAFLYYKLNSVVPETEALNVLLVGVNTFILLTSSFTVVRALEAIQKNDQGGLSLYLFLTIVLGVLFLGGQGFEFATLFGEGITPASGVFGTSFFTLTGFHGLHVLIGVVWALRNLLKAQGHGYSAEGAMGIEAFGLYWHFVDIVWIVLFTVIYLI